MEPAVSAGRAWTYTKTELHPAGTGSDLGAFRLRQDILRHKPDLLFIEFAVNDSAEAHDVQAAMEGIVRHTRRALGTACDIAFIYTLAQTQLDDLSNNRLPPAARLHEPVAVHYRLPSVNVALDAARRLDARELAWDDFSRDACHPQPRGHALYADVLARFFESAVEYVAEMDHPWPEPMTADPWDNGDMLPIAPDTVFPGWTYRPLQNRGGWECFDGLLESQTESSEASFAFNGTAIGLFYQLGPDTGDLLWNIDGGPWVPARLFDQYAVSCTRPHYRMLSSNLEPGPHRLSIRVSPDRDPRSTGHWMRLAALLVRR